MAETPVAAVALSREKLGEMLSLWPLEEEDATWAVVFVSVMPTAGEMGAIREAARICDRVVVARLAPDRMMPPKLAETVRSAGGDILYVPAAANGRLKISLGGEQIGETEVTLAVQTLTTVLPTTVVVSRDAVPVVRLLRGIQGTLGDFFTLRMIG